MESQDIRGVCGECGSTRTKRWADLDEDERIVASRKSGLADGEMPQAERFCARCLSPVPDRDENLV